MIFDNPLGLRVAYLIDLVLGVVRFAWVCRGQKQETRTVIQFHHSKEKST